MAAQMQVAAAVTALLFIVTLLVVGYWQHSRELDVAGRTEMAVGDLPEPTKIAMDLKAAQPGTVVLPTEAEAFRQVMNTYWAQQNREVLPACFVRPRHAQQLSEAICILKKEYDSRPNQSGLFSIKSGGASPTIGCSVLKGGVAIDLCHFRDVEPSHDRSNVTIGAGLKWAEVYKTLEEIGLTVTGGRSLPVGVGGLSLQGGMSFYSPINGFVCSTIISYEVVLADGSIVVSSESSYTDLWRALKGGVNNFGIVTRFTVPCFPAEKIWFGCSYMVGFQASSLIKAFHEYVKGASSGRPGAFDQYATIPISCFGYMQDLGIYGIANFLGYTNPPKNKKWPTYWTNSPFGSLWNLWSTNKVQSLTSAVKELAESSQPGFYNIMATTTCKNNLETLTAAHKSYRDFANASTKVKGLVLSLVLQPVLPGWMNKGYPNVLGLQDCTEPLVIVEITAKWDRSSDDDHVRKEARRFIEQVDATAKTNNSSHPYRFANYCAEWQDPIKSYGEDNLEFLCQVSRKYDPDGLFQRGCTGGFKLGM